MAYQIKTEVDLSPHVIAFWESRGFCVHGEVSVYGKSVFIDHVAHLGPCSDPTYHVAIEMKKGASSSLSSQVQTIDRCHLSDEVWGVAIATPRADTLDKWDSRHDRNWIQPGLLSWNGSELVQHRHSKATLRKNHSRYFKKRAGELLLIPENKGVLAGYPSGAKEHVYCTHWSISVDRVSTWVKGRSAFTTKDLFGNLPPVMESYRKKRSAMGRVLRHLQDEGVISKDGKAGRYNKYAVLK